ncbi:MAG: hypothetical protein U1F98_06190 [Verrucomicrobiota bacterium]
MSRDSHEFEALRRLMALKRHEVPPPGYFNNFSSSVISRIRAGEQQVSWFERWRNQSVFLQKLTALVEARPAFAGAFGAAVFALMISGIVYSENSPISLTTQSLASDSLTPGDALALAEPGMASTTLVAVSSTNAMAPNGGSLFDQIQGQFPLQGQPAALVVPGR